MTLPSPSEQENKAKIPAISARHVTLQFGPRILLDDIDIDIYPGEVTALLGPNGAGKSSLLKLLSGEIPSNAELSYFNQPNHQWDKEKLARHLGVLPQHSTLSFPFVANEVVELGAIPLQLSNKAIKTLAQEKMQLADVGHLADRTYPLLSGGEKQRLHLARVLTQLSKAGEQCILMLDEPTSALDLAHQHNTLRLAKKLAKQSNAAVIVVLHDLNLASQYSDRLILLNNGKLVGDGSPEQTLTPALIEAVYGYNALIAPHPTLGFPMVHAAA